MSSPTKLPKIAGLRSATASPAFSKGEVDEDGNVSGVSGDKKKTATVTLQEIQQGPPLKELHLDSVGLSGTHSPLLVSILVKNARHLEVVSFSDNRRLFSNSAAASILNALKDLQHLNTLKLSDTGLTDSHCGALGSAVAALNTVKRLDMSNNNITPVGLADFLSHITANVLECWDLSRNKVRDEGAVHLRNFLDWNTSLVSLDLSSCWITDKGLVELGLALANQQSLETLALSNNTISPEAVDGFSNIIKKNRTLKSVKGFSGLDLVNTTRLRKLMKRNVDSQNDSLPRALQDELSRLYVQQYKLEMANTLLKDHQQQTLMFHDQALRADMEFSTEKEEISKKAKRATEMTLYQQTVIKELRSRALEMEEQGKKDRESTEAELNSLQDQLNQAVLTREKREVECNTVQAQYNVVRDQHEAKRAELTGQIDDARRETAEYRDQGKLHKKRVEEIMLKIAEAEQRLPGKVSVAEVLESAGQEKEKPKKTKKAAKRKQSSQASDNADVPADEK